MTIERAPLVPPKRGLNDAFAYAEQPQETTRSSKNMRTQENASGRLRVSQRSGSVKHTPFSLFTNYCSYTERLRANEQDDEVSGGLGWSVRANQLTITTDGTLAPDGLAEAELLTQVTGFTSSRVINQIFDVRTPSENARVDAHSSATFLRTSPGDIVFSVFLKPNDSTESRILLRQSNNTVGSPPADGLPLRAEEIDWTTTPPTLTTSGDSLTNTDAGLTDEGDGWYRFYLQIRWDVSSEGTSSLLHCSIVPNNANTMALGIYAWGAQLEMGTLPSNYESVEGINDLEGTRKVANLTHLTYAQRNTDYAERKAPLIDFEGKTPNELDATGVALDRQRARYVLEGASSIVKYAKDGEEVFQIPLPLKDNAHVARSVYVDEIGCIYAGVLSGGDSKTAGIWKFIQGPRVTSTGALEEESFYQLFYIETSAYVVDLEVREGLLYSLQNDPISAISAIVVYDGIGSTQPFETLRIDAPYPSHGLEIKADGSPVVCAPSNATRGIDPRFPEYAARIVSWTPEDYPNWDTVGRAWLDSTRINGRDTSTAVDYAQDDAVDRWVDLTDNERNAFKNPSRQLPTVNLLSAAGLPGLHFNGVDQALISAPNPDQDPESKRLHKTLWPGHTGAEYTCFVAFAPAVKGTQGMVIGQQNSNAGVEERAICANRDEGDTVLNPSTGQICHFDDTTGTGDPATGTDDHPASVSIVNGTTPNTCIVGIVVSASGGTSLFEFDGAGVEPGYSSKAVGGTAATGLGYLEEEGGFDFFEGDLLEIITVDEVVVAAERDKFFAYLAYKWGTSNRLTSASYAPPSPSLEFASTAAPVKPDSTDPNPITATSTVVAKFDPRGDLQWVEAAYTGVGFDIVEDPDGNLFSLGEFEEDISTSPPLGNSFAERGYLRKLIDAGDSVTIESVNAHKAQNIIGLVQADYTPSENFLDPDWTKTNVTVNVDVAANPLGVTNADRLDTTLANGTVLWAGGPGTGFVGTLGVGREITDGQPYTFSVYLKADTAANSKVRLYHDGGTIETSVIVDLANGALTPAGVGAGRHDVFLENAGNDWYRVGVMLDYDSSDALNLRAEITPDSDGGTLDVFAWGAQMERASRPSPYQQGEIAPYSDLFPRMAVDEFGNLYVPAVQEGATGDVEFSLRQYDTNLELQRQILYKGPQGAYQVALGQAPDYTEVDPGRLRNLARFTEDFDTPPWVHSNISVTDDSTVAPDGTLTAALVADTSGAATGFLQLLFDSTLVKDEVDYTFSVYLRPDDATSSLIAIGGVTFAVFTTLDIDWSDPTDPQVTLGSNGAGTHTFTRMQAANGFWRVSVTVTYDSAGGDLQAQVQPDSSGVAGTGGAWVWGAQVEVNSAPTTYQPILGSTPLLTGGAELEANLVDEVVTASPKDTLFPGSNNLDTRRTVLFVDNEPSPLPPRSAVLLGVEKGSVKALSPTQPFETLPGGGSALDQNARYISATTLYQRWFGTDGKNTVVYQPTVDGRVSPLNPTAGELPEGTQLMAAWRGRLLKARSDDDPHAWFASAIEDPFDWDYFSPPLLSTKAVFHGTGRAGRSPDIINSLCPYDDRTLILGCDHALWYLDGDPLSPQGDGSWQLLSDITGMAYGNRAWTKDPAGRLYFFGARGGFYVMAPGQRPVRMTENTIEERLEDVDLDENYVELYYNWKANGIHIFVIPFGNPGAIVNHYFWGERYDEWREDELATTGLQLSAGIVMDGTLSDDRNLILATQDYRLLRWDEDSKDDDDTAIDSKELIGPYSPRTDKEARLVSMTVVLAESLDGATYNQYSGDTAEALGAVKKTGTLVAGRNPNKVTRVRGADFWVEITNNNLGESWAFEEGILRVAQAGRARSRT